MSKGTGGPEGHAPSGRVFADSQKGGRTGDVIPCAVHQECHTVFLRTSVIGLTIMSILVGHPLSCQIHRLAISLLICDAQEGPSTGYILDGLVFFSISRNGHRGLELGTQSLHFVKGHLFTIGKIKLFPNFFA